MAFLTEKLNGSMYSLRSVSESDTPFIIGLRSDQEGRARFLGRGSLDPSDQDAWTRNQRNTPEDYYFVIENRRTGKPEGLISLYNIKRGRAEWGRWIVAPDSVCAVEGLLILLRFAFTTLSLRQVFSRTVKQNEAVVRFHDSMGARRNINFMKNLVVLGDKKFELIEHRISKGLFEKETQSKLSALVGLLSDK